ncbi:MAG TPA: class I SAM-dependent methyltransferase [Clostridia bacterium]|nr:class I SAM-dependent methyltransferase [Clostridia bacterium]
MELSPILYHRLIRPTWFLNRYIYNTLKDGFNFENKKIIDFGCGVGSSAALFSSPSYLGLDCDNRRVEYARKINPGYNFGLLTGNKLPVPDASVDYVLIVSVLHHIASREISDYLNEFRRVLTSTGKVLVIEPCLFKGTYLSNSYMSWFDKGKYIRTEDEYIEMFVRFDYETQIIRRFSQLLLYRKLFFVAVPV